MWLAACRMGICTLQIREACVVERIREVITSEKLPVTRLPTSLSDLPRVTPLWAATCTSLSLETSFVLCVLVPCASEVFAVTTHVPLQQVQLP